MPYIPINHEQYDLLPLCRKDGGEVFDYPSKLIYEAEQMLGSSEGLFPYNFSSYEDYYASVDALIAKHSADCEIVQKLHEVREMIIKMNRKEEWSVSYGQCAITAMLVYDMFGGSIHRIRVNGGGTHYFNKIDGHYIDLTIEQFDLYNIPVSYEPNEQMDRKYCGKNADTAKRYRLLVERIAAELERSQKII